MEFHFHGNSYKRTGRGLLRPVYPGWHPFCPRITRFSQFSSAEPGKQITVLREKLPDINSETRVRIPLVTRERGTTVCARPIARGDFRAKARGTESRPTGEERSKELKPLSLCFGVQTKFASWREKDWHRVLAFEIKGWSRPGRLRNSLRLRGDGIDSQWLSP